MQNLKSVAALGEELGGNIVKWKTTIFGNSIFCRESLLCDPKMTILVKSIKKTHRNFTGAL